MSPTSLPLHLAYDGFDVTVKVQSIMDVLVGMRDLLRRDKDGALESSHPHVIGNKSSLHLHGPKCM